jgi:hypothetical protein
LLAIGPDIGLAQSKLPEVEAFQQEAIQRLVAGREEIAAVLDAGLPDGRRRYSADHTSSGINAKGQIVGVINLPDSTGAGRAHGFIDDNRGAVGADYHGFLRDARGHLTKFNVPGASLHAEFRHQR